MQLRSAFCLLILLTANFFFGCGDEDDIQGASMQSGNVAGQVKDAETKNSISGVIINIDDKTYVTKEDGYYVLADIPVGRNTLNAQKAFYAMYSVNIDIAGNQTLILNIELSKTSSE